VPRSTTGVFTVRERLQAPATSTERRVFTRGSRIGRYVVDGLIGKGGMAEVYLARQEGHARFEQRVVLKRMADDLRGHADLDRMFAREAQIAARLQHPNLVQIFDYQSVDDEVFIVMEHLEGLPMQKLAMPLRASGNPLSVPVVLRCIADAARGLHAAHTTRDDDGRSLGLVHRDISPDNLFLTVSGFTKVLDFGIAKRDDLTTLTGKNELKGKIPYMSPEQIQSDDVDGRSDLFSLGATLFWLLAGQRPFGGANEVATLHAVLTKPPPRLREFRPDVAESVQSLVDSMLEKRRDDRPESAAVVARRCEELGAANHDEAADVIAAVC
jgi:serine/threonine-protein kinase